MTNEMKLLMALCDAMGFEVETVVNKCSPAFDPSHEYRLTKKHATVLEDKMEEARDIERYQAMTGRKL